MELWIRTQDRKKLVKTSCIKVDLNEIYDIDINENEVTLGLYESEKRALEVLDEITKHLVKVNSFELYKVPNTNDYSGGVSGEAYEMPLA